MQVHPMYRLGALALACGIAMSATAAERSWNYTYTAQGLIETADGPRTDVQDVTHYTYDAKGNLTKVTNALGQETLLGNYDNRGNPGTITDANGVVSTLTYSGVDPKLASITAAGSTTSFEHDAVGQLTKITRADGSWLQYTYDPARRLTAITNNLGERVEYDVDVAGKRTAQRLKDATGTLKQQQSWVYDELGRLLRSVGAGAQTDHYQYDLNDNPTGHTNPRQFSSSSSFDALDRLVSQTDALNGVTQLGYDAQDNLTKVQDPRGVTTRYEYDGLGNLTKLISPDSGTSNFEYDAAGNITKQADARGVVVTFSYDALNRLTARHYPATPALDATYSYDATASGNFGIGRLTAIQDGSGTLTYRYDARGNLIEQARNLSVNGQALAETLTFQYDAADQLVGIGYPGAVQVGYPRNAGGQVGNVTLTLNGGSASNLASGISYLPFGPLQQLTWANGIQLTRQYDQDYQLTRQDVGPWRNDYQRDANGNITELANNLWGTLSYGYDALDRLTSENTTAKQGSYSYDAVGNRTQRQVTENGATATTTYQYASDSNRLTAINGQTVSADAAGNLTEDRASRLLGYDAQNRLATVKINGQQVAEYRYNSLGQRVAKLTGQGFTAYLYGPDGQLLAETDYNSTATQQRSQAYFWLDSMPLASVEKQGSNAPRMLYLHSDHLNTPRLATLANQQIAWQWQSDAFGKGVPNQDPQGSGLQTVLNLRFPGQYFDAESDLHYNFLRDYDPDAGRYVESDPIGLSGGLNSYAYALSSPLNLSDPTGQNPGAVAGAGTGFIIGGPPGAAIGAAIGFTVGAVGAYIAWDTYHSSTTDEGETPVASSPGSAAEQQAERKEYNRVCKSKITTGDKCQDAKANLDRLKQCVTLRENYSAKWFNDNEPGHVLEIANTKRAIEKLKDFLKNECGENCE
ncbi:RHS repeat-associated core domain-containing protein [Pseudomonas nitroreducens]|uniref:RHS repeat-associated core domain-containing protein n=1 Tax=Pseudomonas nitroreducens TaxID=46680 RepID=UPI00265A6CC1|nr:RHS repeat-associated core domain-containing protein [Pseudomonas nitroreducens]MCP1646653.1 RHS repeat-associated protein [Pseudomonas nitroreducens]MCP1685229.1 RHS repeat-associated protein [Pseudomonas nitroreducens]